MLTSRLDITYTMIWSLAIANILGSGLCLMFTSTLAKVALVRINLIAPLVIAVVFLAAFQATAHFGDLWSLIAISFFGWFMKRFGWPRPPVILGLVLSGIIENYLFISVSRYGATWLLRPIVVIIMLLVVVSLVFGLRMTAKAGTKKAPVGKQPLRFKFNAGVFFTLFVLAVFAVGVYAAADWQIQARLFPWVIGIPALVMCVMQLFGDFFRRGDANEQDVHGAMDLPVDRSVPIAVVVKRAINSFGWVLGLFAAIWIVGFVVAVPLFIFLYLIWQAREKLWISTAYCVSMLVFIVGVFHLILNVPWPEGLFPQAEEWILRRVESFV